MIPTPTGPPPPPAPGWITRWQASVERFVPFDIVDADLRRRAALFITFSGQGVVFGLAFAGFYLFIGHHWGALIVLVCTAAMGGAPWIVRGAGLERAGNVYAGVLVGGFTALTAMEGGLHGHAVAWLAVVPLCACILVDQAMGRLWCVICLAIMAVFCGLDLAGVRLAPWYAPRWDVAVTSAGYLSLTVFMATIGIFFERGRRHSLEKLRGALDALATANTRLAHVDKERREFLSIAAHDLRNPLNTIMGFAQLMRDLNPPDDPDQRDWVERIIAGGGRMRDLLDRLLSAQAIEEGKLRLRLETCDLDALAKTAVENHRLLAEKKAIALELRPAAVPCAVQGDKDATMQVLDNLLSNAIKFSPPGKPITVSVLTQGGNGSGQAAAGRVEVRDAGPGLSEEDQQKLYGKFVRLSAQPTAGESSNGLGLSIVKRLAEEMGGELTCRSKLGEGATFALTLPKAEG